MSLFDAVNVNPSFVKSNFIPAKVGIKFFVDIAFDTLFKFSNNNYLLIFNFIFFPSFFYIFIYILLLLLWILLITLLFFLFLSFF